MYRCVPPEHCRIWQWHSWWGEDRRGRGRGGSFPSLPLQAGHPVSTTGPPHLQHRSQEGKKNIINLIYPCKHLITTEKIENSILKKSFVNTKWGKDAIEETIMCGDVNEKTPTHLLDQFGWAWGRGHHSCSWGWCLQRRSWLSAVVSGYALKKKRE